MPTASRYQFSTSARRTYVSSCVIVCQDVSTFRGMTFPGEKTMSRDSTPTSIHVGFLRHGERMRQRETEVSGHRPTLNHLESVRRIARAANVRVLSRKIGPRLSTLNRSNVPDVIANLGKTSPKMHTSAFRGGFRRSRDIGGLSALFAHIRPFFPISGPRSLNVWPTWRSHVPR